MILSQAQATATYNALCELNNVRALKGVTMSFVGSDGEGDYQKLTVAEDVGGEVRVMRGPGLVGREREDFPSWEEFRNAYGIQ